MSEARVPNLFAAAETLRRLDRDDIVTGVSEKDEVYRDGKLRLYRYRPRTDDRFPIPIVVVYALFNRFTMMDLEEDRSIIRSLLDRGLDVYMVDWGYPDRSDRWLTLDDYVSGMLDDCVDVVRARHELEAVNMLGVCQGGVTALLYAALEPAKVQNLITMVTPVDFDVDGIVNHWIRDADAGAAVDALGLIPGELISLGFLLRSPFERNLRKYVDVVDIVDDERKLLQWLRMEKWIFDTPDVPGETFREWIEDFYQHNKLIKGEVVLGGRAVNLRDVTMPVLNVFAEEDDLIPPASARVLDRYVGTSDVTTTSFPVGHIGMYVSSKVQRDLPRLLDEWIRARA